MIFCRADLDSNPEVPPEREPFTIEARTQFHVGAALYFRQRDDESALAHSHLAVERDVVIHASRGQ